MLPGQSGFRTDPVLEYADARARIHGGGSDVKIFPPIPPWDGMHPLVVHFPVALLMVAPLFVVVGLVFFKQRIPYLISAWILMLLGTIGAFVAVSTGEAGAQLVDRTPEISKALEHHEELAEAVRIFFLILTSAYTFLLFAPLATRKQFGRPTVLTIGVVFLLVYLAGMIVLANTAHAGGLLVHEYGVKAMISQAGPPGFYG